MKIFKSKKFIISLAVIVLIISGIIGIQVKAHAKENLEAYQKYCTSECTLTKVNNDQLEETIKLREEKAKTSISKSNKSIENLTKYLNDHDLNAEEQKSLDAIKLKEVYSDKSDYTVDQLIEMESNYKSVAKELSNLKALYRTRYLTSKIVANNKAIKKSKESLKDYDLNETESKTKKAIDKKLTYDSEKNDYTVEELSDLNKVYKQAKEDYETLLSDTIKRTTADEKKAQEQAIIDAAGVDYDTTLPDEAYLNNSSSSDYDTSTDTSTTTNSSSTNSNSSTKASSSKSSSSSSSNSSHSTDSCYDSQGRFNSDCINGDTYQDNSNSSGGRVCEYPSESAAISAAESQILSNDMTGYGVYPCAEGTWEIYWK